MTRDALAVKKESLDPHFSMKDEFLLWKGRWYIPEGIYLKNMILYDNHDTKIEGQFSRYRTLERHKYNYHWPMTEENIKDSVQAYNTCDWDKLNHNRRYGQLESLEVI